MRYALLPLTRSTDSHAYSFGHAKTIQPFSSEQFPYSVDPSIINPLDLYPSVTVGTTVVPHMGVFNDPGPGPDLYKMLDFYPEIHKRPELFVETLAVKNCAGNLTPYTSRVRSYQFDVVINNLKNVGGLLGELSNVKQPHVVTDPIIAALQVYRDHMSQFGSHGGVEEVLSALQHTQTPTSLATYGFSNIDADVTEHLISSIIDNASRGSLFHRASSFTAEDIATKIKPDMVELTPWHYLPTGAISDPTPHAAPIINTALPDPIISEGGFFHEHSPSSMMSTTHLISRSILTDFSLGIYVSQGGYVAVPTYHYLVNRYAPLIPQLVEPSTSQLFKDVAWGVINTAKRYAKEHGHYDLLSRLEQECFIDAYKTFADEASFIVRTEPNGEVLYTVYIDIALMELTSAGGAVVVNPHLA